jgi:transposase-like protein
MRNSRLSKTRQRELVLLFVEEKSSREAALATGLNKDTCALYFYRLRLVIFESQYGVDFNQRSADEKDGFFGVGLSVQKFGFDEFKTYYSQNHKSSITGEYRYHRDLFFWQLVRRLMSKYKGFPSKHACLYAAEFDWRYSTKSDGERFFYLMQMSEGRLW